MLKLIEILNSEEIIDAIEIALRSNAELSKALDNAIAEITSTTETFE
jgi:hypothetical protein